VLQPLRLCNDNVSAAILRSTVKPVNFSVPALRGSKLRINAAAVAAAVTVPTFILLGGLVLWLTHHHFARLTVSTSSSVLKNVGGQEPTFQVNGTAGSSSALMASRFSNNRAPARFFCAKSRGATIGSYTIVQDGDEVCDIDFVAADGNDLIQGPAQIKAVIDGTPSSNVLPGRLEFSTTPGGDYGSRLVRRLSIKPDGGIIVGDGSSSPGAEGLLVEGSLSVAPRLYTIASGAISLQTSNAFVDTESGAAIDELASIEGGVSGQVLFLKAAKTGRTVVIKDGIRNIQGSGDCTLDSNLDVAHLLFDSALNLWLIITCANNG
jgi:hypothetical protein